jgi:hypothetical protein
MQTLSPGRSGDLLHTKTWIVEAVLAGNRRSGKDPVLAMIGGTLYIIPYLRAGSCSRLLSTLIH